MDQQELSDSLDRAQVEQLHQLCLQLSKNCFEIKRLCVTILVSASVLIGTFTQRRLDWAIFVGAAIVVAFFYLLDVQSYYYQRKARAGMRELANAVLSRGGLALTLAGFGLPLGSKSREEPSIRRALLNPSMCFYAVLALLDLLVTLLWYWEMLASLSPVEG